MRDSRETPGSLRYAGTGADVFDSHREEALGADGRRYGADQALALVLDDRPTRQSMSTTWKLAASVAG